MAVGRWSIFTQEDPIGLAGGLNLYGFANGDPVNFSDPFGLCPERVTRRPCLNPLHGAALTVRSDMPSGFGARSGTHQGVDLLAALGSEVSAADAGILEMREDSGGYGTYAVVWHGESATVYAHLSGFAEGIEDEMRVTAGQVFAYTGDTGNAGGTTPHLHFEIWEDFRKVGTGLSGRIDPVPELPMDERGR